MRAIKGRMEGNLVHLLEPMPPQADQEVVVLIPTEPNEQALALLLFAGVWSNMPEEEWQTLQQALAQGVQIGEQAS